MHTHKVFIWIKAILKAWFDRFTKVVKNLGYNQAHANPALFYKRTTNGRITILSMYVDDIILNGDNIEEMKKFKTFLAKEFEIKDLGALKLFFFLGMEVARIKKGILVSQRKYTIYLLLETEMLGTSQLIHLWMQTRNLEV